MIVNLCAWGTTTMTTITVSLDPNLSNAQGTGSLNKAHGYLYLVAFNGSTSSSANGSACNWNGTSSNVLTLVNAGVQSANLSGALTPGTSTALYPANYVIVESANELDSSVIGQLGQLTAPGNATTYHYNFTSIEGDLLRSSGDELDMTAINSYGPNISLSVPGMPAGAISTLGYSSSLNNFMTDLPSETIDNNKLSTPSPTLDLFEINGTPGNSYYYGASGVLEKSFSHYLTALSVTPPHVTNSLLNGMMFSQNGGNLLNLVRVTYDSTNDVFAFNPLFKFLPGQNTNFSGDSGFDPIASMSVSGIISNLNNPPGGTSGADEAYQMFLGGTESGFWATKGTYANPLDSSTSINPTPGSPAVVDLSQSWNWARYYAYDGASAKGSVAAGGSSLGNIDVTSALTPAKGDTYYDSYAGHSLYYGSPYAWSYSDLMSNQGGQNPQIVFGDRDFTINVWDNATTPTAGTGYVQPPSGYVAPNGATYASANTFAGAGNGNVLSVNFAEVPGNGYSYVPDTNYPITLRIYDPAAKNAGLDGFVNVSLATATSTASPWSYWTLALDNNNNIVASNRGASYDQINLNPGQMVIDNLPTASTAGAPSWYQIVIGNIGLPNETVYDFYASTSAADKGIISALTSPAVVNQYSGIFLNVPQSDSGAAHIPTQTEGFSLFLSQGANWVQNTSNTGFTYNPLSLFSMNDLFVGTQYQLIKNGAVDSHFGTWVSDLQSGKKHNSQWLKISSKV